MLQQALPGYILQLGSFILGHLGEVSRFVERRGLRNDAVAQRQGYRFGAAGGLQLVENVRQVSLHGAVTDAQLHRNGLVGKAFGCQRQHFGLFRRHQQRHHRGIDGLARVCRESLGADPFSGAVFVFRGKRGTAIKLLVYDGQGFWLCHKRLSQGRFRWWPSRSDGAAALLRTHANERLMATALAMILGGAVGNVIDRIRLGEADVMIAAGTETMSLMSQMMGNKVSLNPAVFDPDGKYLFFCGDDGNIYWVRSSVIEKLKAKSVETAPGSPTSPASQKSS